MKYPHIREKIEWSNPKYRYRFGNRSWSVKDVPTLVYKGYITAIRGNDIPYGSVRIEAAYPEKTWDTGVWVVPLSQLSRRFPTQLQLI